MFQKDFLIKPRGTQDIYPPRSLLFHQLYLKITEVLIKNNYRLFIFPTFEYEDLFKKLLGEDTNVQKEMYLLVDKKSRRFALRPEGTISVARLVCQNKLLKGDYPIKAYYWANMYRYERPQAGRHREFCQLGVELINSNGVRSDGQILKLAFDILTQIDVNNFSLNLNYLGGEETKQRYLKFLEIYLKDKRIELCKICQVRYTTNPLRMLDCVICRENLKFPSYELSWSSQDKEYVNFLNIFLDSLNISYYYDFKLVRGLDYYDGLVFEVFLDKGGTKAILGGGRYNKLYGLISNNKNDVSAIGFAIGIDRVIDFLFEKKRSFCGQLDIFFLTTTSLAYQDILSWKGVLNKHGWIVDYNLEIKINQKWLSVANYYQPKLLIVLKEKEFLQDCVMIMNFDKKPLKRLVKKNDLIDWIKDFFQQARGINC